MISNCHPLHIVCSTIALLLLAASLCSAELTLHVSPTGSDDADGSAAAPFATIHRARDEVRAIKQRSGLPEGGIRVLLQDGLHALSEPLTLGPEDSGSAEAPVIYAAAPDASPIISGGRIISGLTRQPDGSFATTIPEAAERAWVFRQLFIDGRRYIHARSPNEGQFTSPGGVPAEDGEGNMSDRFIFRPGDLQPWPNIGDVEVMLYFSWNEGNFPLQSVDAETRTAIL
ncbi:MAG: hypothetical protein GX131_16000, partial [candidate division WS1 bacterium]|nr:hypothetical protein [candidate division WS1 bacterium]